MYWTFYFSHKLWCDERCRKWWKVSRIQLCCFLGSYWNSFSQEQVKCYWLIFFWAEYLQLWLMIWYLYPWKSECPSQILLEKLQEITSLGENSGVLFIKSLYTWILFLYPGSVCILAVSNCHSTNFMNCCVIPGGLQAKWVVEAWEHWLCWQGWTLSSLHSN